MSRKAEWSLLVGVPVLALLLALLYADPFSVGSFEDDAMYLSLARSLAHGQGMRVDLLPGSPHIAKYPPLYPQLLSLPLRFGLNTQSNTGLWWLLAMQSLAMVAAMHLFINVLLRDAKFNWIERWLALVMIVFNASFLHIHVALMSEGLFLLLMVGQLICLAEIGRMGRIDRPETPVDLLRSRTFWHEVGLALFVFLGCLVRGATMIVAIGYLPVLAWRRQWRAAVLLVLAMGLSAGINSSMQNRGASPANDPIAAPAYYYSYTPHVEYYLRDVRDAGIATAITKLRTVAKANVHNGLVSLKRLFLPDEQAVTNSTTAAANSQTTSRSIGLAIFGLAIIGLASSRRTAMLLPVLLIYALFFVCWTWPFTGRFWAPMLPVIVAGLVGVFRWLRQSGLIALGVIVLVITLVQGMLLFGHIASRRHTSEPLTIHPSGTGEMTASDATQLHLDWLKQNLLRDRGDTILGGFNTLWTARHANVAGVWLGAMLDIDYLFPLYINTAVPPRITHEEAGEQLWRDVLTLRSKLPTDVRVIVQRDFTTAPSQSRIIEQWLQLHRLTPIDTRFSEHVQLYELNIRPP